ncbi:hypothetical protein SAMN05216229_11529 [Geopseudomonas sagittaria]|uniref:Uncharacterized protein n=1 Tax=Geopseudomonas sagittaria TaxID=1135990 RepID=A0A1I5X521_9GAMM|nr:hypothetical protein [Pseudomonas sagittaria]SFQ26971.1 hypothetical protein SAMN05216229_11529 [Pseudomonas sagittaria]
MKEQLVELITLISSGSLGDEDIRRIAGEATLAYADPQAFRAANPDVDREDDLPITLGERVLLGSLPDSVLLQAKQADELFQQVLDTFGAESPCTLKAGDLAEVDLLTALERIQVELSSLYPQTEGYELVDFGEPLEQPLQMVLVYTRDLPRVLELSGALGIYAAPAYERRLSELGDGEDG